MAHDLVVRGGTVVDGIGSEPVEADIAIDGNSITAIGRVAGRGAEEVEAKGHVVTPGFIDLHTHLDAQIGWDPEMTSITWHGVTTALLGNCGVTFAPCRKEDREFLAGMMETVEDIPKHAILTGLPWDWESYGGYLDSIERLGPMINVCGLVGHSATRFYVMGERAIEEQATPEEIEQIAALAGQSVREGAFGFSVNRHPGHTLPDRRPIPGTFASREELVAIARAVGAEGGIMQTVPNFGKVAEEMDIMAEEAETSRILFSAIGEHREPLDEHVTEMRAKGLDVTGITVPRSGGGVGGLSANIMWWTPTWRSLNKLDFEARLAAIQDESFRAKLIAEVRDHEQTNEHALRVTKRWYPLGGEARPNYTQSRYESLADIAREAAGEHPTEAWLQADPRERRQGAVPPARLQREPGQPGEAHHHGVGDARARRCRRPRQPDDRLGLGDLRAVALVPRQGHLHVARGRAPDHVGAGPRARLGRPGHARRRQEGRHQRGGHRPSWRSASRTWCTTSRAVRRASSSGPKATRRRCVTVA